MRDPLKGRQALRRGRASLAGREYFLTICTEGGAKGLTIPAVADRIIGEAKALDHDKTWRLRCCTIMPDHVHILMVLGERLSLGKCLARLKSKSRGVLRLSNPECAWERDFFDRLLRPEDDRLALFLYLFLNPYRASVCRPSEHWPWFWCREDDWAWLKDYLDEERPVPDWLL